MTTLHRFRRFLSLLILLTGLMGSQACVLAAPSNDNFANATTIIGITGMMDGTNVNASHEVGEPNIAYGGFTVWYRWTAPASGGATFTVAGDFRGFFKVYTGSSLANLSEPAYQSTGTGTTTFTKTFNAIAGTTYSIQVQDYNFETGHFMLSWIPGPANDNFSSGRTVAGVSIDVSGTNINASPEIGEPNIAYGGFTVWYRWTAPASGGATFTVAGDFRGFFKVYTGSSLANLSEPAYQSTGTGTTTFTKTFNAIAGTTYYIQVQDYNFETGHFTLYGGLAPTNDMFANAQALNGRSGRVTGINLPASSEPGEPNHGGITGGASVWYRWTAQASGVVTFNTDGSDFNTLLGVYTGTNVASLTTVGGDDNYDFGTNFSGTTVNGSSAVQFHATQGVTYSIAVDGFGGLTGHVVLNWESADPPISLHGAPQGDVIFQNRATGAVYYYFLTGASKVAEGYIWSGGDPNWKLVCTPDINGDGQPDMVFQNPVNGAVYYYLMNGVNKVGEGYLWTGGDPQWKLILSTDLNGDGKGDVVFQHQGTGQTWYYLLNGGSKIGEGSLWDGGNPNWKLVGAADLNFDGHPDFIFQNSAQLNGSLYYHLMNGVVRIGEGTLWIGDDSNKHVVAIADMNGDGKPDLLVQNSANGAVTCLLLNGPNVFDTRTIWSGGDPAWKLTGVTELNRDGKPDLLFQNAGTGAVYYYLMNGVTKTNEGYIWTGGDPAWSLLPYLRN